MRSPDELRALADERLEALELWPHLRGQAESVRYSLEVGGKRVRPVICLATAEAVGADVETAVPAALALELIHTFSLVHDDLPALDDDEERRGHPSTWRRSGSSPATRCTRRPSGWRPPTRRRRSRASSPRQRSG
jgi:geranylgeranyl pyrophosphate synthase